MNRSRAPRAGRWSVLGAWASIGLTLALLSGCSAIIPGQPPGSGRDAGPVRIDAGPPRDAGPLPDAGPPVMSCPPNCDCTGASTCAFECGNNCDTSCTDTSSCAIDATGATSFTGTCDVAASCQIDCQGVTNCAVVCDGTAACLVDCTGSTLCNQSGTACTDWTDCGANIFVCNRACP